MQDNKTANLLLPLPNAQNQLADDVGRIISALNALDAFVHQIQVVLTADDTALDTIQEIITRIKSDEGFISSLVTGKVNVSDIVDGLTSTATNKPLSANQGNALKSLIDAINNAKGAVNGFASLDANGKLNQTAKTAESVSGSIAAGATATTQTAGDASTKVATTAFVDALRDVASNPQSASYTLALTDRGKSIDTTAGVTVPPNSAVAFPVGATITITNCSSSAAITITQGAGVALRQAGVGSSGNRTLAAYGVATLRKIATDIWIVAGAGLS